MFLKEFTFRIMVIKPEAKMPSKVEYENKYADIPAACRTLAANWPGYDLHIVRQKGFKQGKPMRWGWLGDEMVEVAYYDRSKGTIPMDKEWEAIGFVPTEASRSR